MSVWSLPSSYTKERGICTLPDGRKVVLYRESTYDGDTNYWDTVKLDIFWAGGNPLTSEELNKEIGDDFLHSWAEANAEWTTVGEED